MHGQRPFLPAINLLFKVNLYQTKIWLKNYTIQLLENLKNEKHVHLLKTIFGVLAFKLNKGVCFLSHVIDIYSKYVWVVSLKDQKCIATTHAFQKAFTESGRKPNKTTFMGG